MAQVAQTDTERPTQTGIKQPTKTVQLARYIKYLEKENVVDFNIIGEGDPYIQNRLRIQYCVFLAKRFGLDLSFGFDGYLYGPSSESLAEQCNILAENRQDLYDPVRPDLPQGFDSSGFLDFVRGRSNDWLNIAATLIEFNTSDDEFKDMYQDRDRLLGKVSDLKYRFSRRYVSDVLDAVELAGLVRFPL